MGIHKLGKLISDLCKGRGLYEDVLLSVFSGAKIAFDATGWSCEIMAAANGGVVESTNHVTGEVDYRQVTASFLRIVCDKLSTLFELNITPVFVFDGPALPDKALTRAIRINHRLEAINKAETARDQLREGKYENKDKAEERVETLLKQTWNLHPNDTQALRQLLAALGVPQVQAKHDAERTCALLNRYGYVDACYTSDSDALPFGGLTIIRDIRKMDINGRSTAICSYWIRQQILEQLRLTDEQLIDFCICCGCDFNTPIRNISSNRALQLIQMFGFIENFPQIQPGWLDPKDPRTGKSIVSGLPQKFGYNLNLLNHVRCREIFSMAPIEEVIVSSDLDVTVYTMDEILRLASEFNFGSRLTRLLKTRNSLQIRGGLRNIVIKAPFQEAPSSSSQTLTDLGLPQAVTPAAAEIRYVTGMSQLQIPLTLPLPSPPPVPAATKFTEPEPRAVSCLPGSGVQMLEETPPSDGCSFLTPWHSEIECSITTPVNPEDRPDSPPLDP